MPSADSCPENDRLVAEMSARARTSLEHEIPFTLLPWLKDHIKSFNDSEGRCRESVEFEEWLLKTPQQRRQEVHDKWDRVLLAGSPPRFEQIL